VPKKLSEIQKKEIIDLFINGEPIEVLAEKYNFTKITIRRYLKQSIDQKNFQSLSIKNKKNKSEDVLNKFFQNESKTKNLISEDKSYEINSGHGSSFVELTPMNFEIENEPQKDLSSISISEMDFPKIVYMIVDKKIELEIKYLKEYPEWQFLSKEELSRKTIEIYLDLKIAKRFCNKEQKVIKVPNPNVFKIAASLLLRRGISRIVSAEKLIAL
tara:strand:- start:2921 stop:3565 length:645 start_codon:yes stop_codon:yes gene_type:complete